MVGWLRSSSGSSLKPSTDQVQHLQYPTGCVQPKMHCSHLHSAHGPQSILAYIRRYKLKISSPCSYHVMISVLVIVPTANPESITTIAKSTHSYCEAHSKLSQQSVRWHRHQAWLTYVLMGQHQWQFALADHGELSLDAFTTNSRAVIL